MGIAFCSQCGSKTVPDARFCIQCGSPLSGDIQKSNGSVRKQSNPQSDRLEKFMEEVVTATKGRSQGKVQVEYADEEGRKSSENGYKESLAAATMVLGLMLRGNDI